MSDMKKQKINQEALSDIFQKMFDVYGVKFWWSADSILEVAVGAILTQNTMWSNVEKAINNLKDANVLNFKKLTLLPDEKLAELIYPSGYYNIKAKRIKSFLGYLKQIGGIGNLKKMELQQARKGLLSVNGIGPETADDILLYGLNLPVFVIDVYTRRILQRINFISGNEDYEYLRSVLESNLPRKTDVYKEYHALFVEHAKQVCKKKPDCEKCCLGNYCPGLSPI